VNAMQSAFVSDENDRDQNKHYDENDALFVFGEFKNSKKGLHRMLRSFFRSIFGAPLPLGSLQVVILSKAKNLSHSFLQSPSPTARDVSLRST